MKYTQYEDIIGPNTTVKYADDVHDIIPEDAIVLTDYEWQLATQHKLRIDPVTKVISEYVRPVVTEEEQYFVDLDSILSQRKSRYKLESDSLKNEAEYDAIIAALEPNYTLWLAKVALIKAELPLPTEPIV